MLGLMVVLLQATAACDKCDAARPWNDWQAFQRDLIRPEGRVVDVSDPREITTSEGQSYALFFALVDNDPVLFRRLLRWTERELAYGDLTAHLPAWLWGRKPDGSWGVLDDNTASDANLWIAYALLEAGRLWRQHSYTVLGNLLLQRIAHEEVSSIARFGPVLLPGKRGFYSETELRLNPSYAPLQLLARAHQAQPGSVWALLQDSTVQFLIESSPVGLAPDWVDLHHGEIEPTREGRIGSYNAIRVYLWVGMMHSDAVGADRLVPHFQQGLEYLDFQGVPPEHIDIFDGSASEQGPIGFSAAMLPLFGGSEFGRQQRARVTSAAMQEAGYYSRVLSLFGTAWDQQRFSFDAQGYVKPAWRVCP